MERKCTSLLVVEDDLDIRESLRDALESEGYVVRTAANGEEGLGVLRESREPCLILLDLMMPIMDGWQFLEARRADPRLALLPVIVLSAAGEDQTRTAEADARVRKPVDLDELFEAIGRFAVRAPASP